MKKIIVSFLTAIAAVTTISATCFAKDYQRALAKVDAPGQTVTVKVKLDTSAKVYGYQSLISYDPQILEFEGVTKTYFPQSKTLEDGLYGTIYKVGESAVGYESMKTEEGKIYYLSSAVSGTVLKNSEDVISLKFTSKEAGESFITFADVHAYVGGEEDIEAAATYFNVESPVLTDTSYTFADAVVNKEIYDLSNAKTIKVNYPGQDVEIKVENGKILCETENPFEGDVTPAIVKVSFDGTQTPLKPVYNDKSSGKIKFAVKDFGTYYIVPVNPTVTDVADTEGAEIVKMFAAENIVGDGGIVSYRPDDKITKAEFMKLIACASDLLDENAKCTYADVSIADWFYPYVASVNAAGVIDNAENFFPESTISGAEACEIAARALKTEQITNVYANEISRLDAAKIIYETLAKLF